MAMTSRIKLAILLCLGAAGAMNATHSRAGEKDPVIRVTPEAEEKIISDYAEQQKWCDNPPAEIQSGKIRIYWTRDDSGKCTEQKIVVHE